MTFSNNGLAGHLILVTGASSGIGRDAAIRFSHCGARLILAGRNEDRLSETNSLLSRPAERLLSMDLSDDTAVDDALQSVTKGLGALDGVFHCAGVLLVQPARMTKRRQIDEVFGASVYGSLGIARAAARKGVMNNGGSLVFMSSTASRRGRQGLLAYSAAKAAVVGLVRSLAMELAERRIRVNSIAAGAVQTSMHDEVSNSLSGSMMAEYQRLHPLGFGRAEDVSNAAIFLLSEASRWITGTNLAVDGGYGAK